MTFWGATFIGKAFFKAAIQTVFVIFLFSKENIEFLITAITKLSPDFGNTITTWLEAQKHSFLRPKDAAALNNEVKINVEV